MSSLTLVDADTFQPISQYNPIVNGATINRATLPTQNVTIQANTSPATLGSVAFDLVDSGYLNTVNTAPYDLCGTAPCSNLGVGLHSLNATPYMGPNGSGGAGKAMSISFSVIDPTPTPVSTPSPTPTPAPKATTLTSTLVLTSANNGQTFNNYRISTTSGPCISATGASNVTISNSNIGPCGTDNSTAASQGIVFNGGSGNQVYDSYIHVENKTASTAGVETHAGILASGSPYLTAQGNVIAYTGTGITSDGSNGSASDHMSAIGNYVLQSFGNITGSSGATFASGIQAVQADYPTITNNYIYNCVTSGPGVSCVGGPYLYDEAVADDINVFKTSDGTITNNYIVGGHMGSGDAFTADAGGNNNNISGNIAIGSQGGIQINSGINNVMDSNKVIQTQSITGNDIPFAVLNDYPGAYACGPSTVTNNIGDNTARGNTGFYNAGDCGTVTLSGNIFGTAADSFLLPVATKLPPPLIPPRPKTCVAKSPFSTQTSMPLCP